MISLKNVLAALHTLEVCSLTVVTYDRRRKDRRGRRVHYPEAKLIWGDGKTTKKQPTGERQMTNLERSLCGADQVDKRNPNHSHFYSRNIRVYQMGNPTEMIVKIHPPLIVEFNGKTTCP